jgi:hypothetical protein
MPEKKSTSANSTSIADKGTGGSDLGRAGYRAEQARDAVIIFAFGWHPTPGYTDFFEQSPIDVFPPEFIFRSIPPGGMVPQVLTPFAIWMMFGASEPIKTVTIHDADGPHEVPVEQVTKVLAASQARGTWISGSVVRSGAAAAAVFNRPTTMAVGEETPNPTTMATGEEDITAPTTMATGEEGGGGPTTMATGEEQTQIATTLAVGEEEPPITTLAVGEEGTTLRIGEEGPTTLALGEETTTTQRLVATTLALGEEDPTPTTQALGEEGPTTMAVGEEGPTTDALGEEGPTTMALGEENTTVALRSSPFGTF